MQNKFREVVLSTVNAEHRRQRTRQRNIVISGVEPVAGKPDVDIAKELLDREFNIDIAVHSCNRLGIPLPNRIQLLRVCLPRTEDADHIISIAKLLRNSQDQYVRSSVYINRDLTRSERQLAYENRCRRREAVTVDTVDGRQQHSRTFRSRQVNRSTIPVGATSPTAPTSRAETSSGVSTVRGNAVVDNTHNNKE